MRISTRTRSGRAGFTLVELLVAAALSILIMAVLSTAFQTGLQTLSTLKSLGDMAERLKTAETLLRTDLNAEHFANDGNTTTAEAGDGSPTAMRLSDLRYDLPAPSALPTKGYFQIYQFAGSFGEGLDADNLPSSHASGLGNERHGLSMTVKRQSRTPDQLFVADLSQLPPAQRTEISGYSSTDLFVSGNQLVTQWGQVDWFLDYNNTTTVNGVPTWPLIRRVRAVCTDGMCPRKNVVFKSLTTNVATLRIGTPHNYSVGSVVRVIGVDGTFDGAYVITAIPTADTFTYARTAPDVVGVAATGQVLSAPKLAPQDTISVIGDNQLALLQDLANPVLRATTLSNATGAAATAIALPSAKVGDDIVITNVLSFEVRPVYTAATGPGGVVPPPNPDGIFQDLPTGSPGVPRVFDSGLGAVGNNRIRVLAVQVKIRVYDPKNKLTRQTTLVVKL